MCGPWRLLLVSLVLGLQVGCGAAGSDQALAPIVTLTGEWRLMRGFESAWLRSPPPGETIRLPARLAQVDPAWRGYRGWITLQREVPPEIRAALGAGDPLAFRSGWLGDVSELYINNVRAGALGREAPYQSGLFRFFLTALPAPSAAAASGSAAGAGPANEPVYITLRLYSPGDTELEVGGPLELGPADAIYRRFVLSEALSLLLIGGYLAAGFAYLLLGLRRPAERYYWLFGATCVLASAYWFLRLGLRDFVFGDATLLRLKLEYGLLYCLPPFFLMFLAQFLERRYSRPAVLLAIASSLFVVVTAAAPYSVVRIVLSVWQFLVIPVVAYLVAYIVRAALRERPRARYLVAGVTLLGAASVYDILGARGLHQGAEISRYALFFCVAGIGAMLARDFFRLSADLETLNAQLKQRYLEINREKEAVERENAALQDLSRLAVRRFVRAAHKRLIIYSGPAMERVMELIDMASRTDAPVLIEGESGTGKELAAALIHRRSAAARGPFVALNCAAIPEALLENELFGHEKGAYTGADRAYAGRFEESNGGSLFLDEIGETPLALQAKLLRVLQERSYRRLGGKTSQKWTGRLILATHRNLERMIQDKQFREDLYYRIKVITIRIPPLRERREDILTLADYFLKTLSRRLKKPIQPIDDAFRSALLRYTWPGNVRELENALFSAMILARDGRLRPEDLPEPARNATPGADIRAAKAETGTTDFDQTIGELERSLLQRALTTAAGNKSEAARLLQLSRKRFTYKLRQYQLE